MLEVANDLRTLVESAEILRQVSEDQSEQPALRGGWSRKQLLGHLIDSASNNHQRFVRAAIAGELVFPGYAQDENVRVQAVQELSWELLITLWASYNRLLAHVIAKLPEDKLQSQCRIGDGEPVTLEFLVKDYLGHLKHHLEQIGIM